MLDLTVTYNVSQLPTDLLTHPPFCPIKQLSAEQAASLPPDITSRGVNVGVVVILGGCHSVNTDTATIFSHWNKYSRDL